MNINLRCRPAVLPVQFCLPTQRVTNAEGNITKKWVFKYSSPIKCWIGWTAVVFDLVLSITTVYQILRTLPPPGTVYCIHYIDTNTINHDLFRLNYKFIKTSFLAIDTRFPNLLPLIDFDYSWHRMFHNNSKATLKMLSSYLYFVLQLSQTHTCTRTYTHKTAQIA
jgi:hypothetical protein